MWVVERSCRRAEGDSSGDSIGDSRGLKTSKHVINFRRVKKSEFDIGPTNAIVFQEEIKGFPSTSKKLKVSPAVVEGS